MERLRAALRGLRRKTRHNIAGSARLKQPHTRAPYKMRTAAQQAAGAQASSSR
jgi:hypothetical protein